MKRYFLWGLLLLLIPLVKTNALYCQYSDISYLKKLASNINASYDYIEIDGKIKFSITLTNLQPELYLVDSLNNRYDYKGSELTIQGYYSGQTVQYKVYTTREYCEEELLYTIRLTLPNYNPYYKDEVCKGIENYNLCNRWTSHNLTYSDFLKKVSQYKSNIKVEETIVITPIEPDDSIVQYIIHLLFKYYYVVLILIILGSGIGIYILNKKSNEYY